jgi:hypothetical protein
VKKRSINNMKKISKSEAKEKIEEFFKNPQDKKPEEIKKIKKLAMHYNLKLGDKRKKFCKKCYSTKIRIKSIKNNIKTVNCENGHISRWKIK